MNDWKTLARLNLYDDPGQAKKERIPFLPTQSNDDYLIQFNTMPLFQALKRSQFISEFKHGMKPDWSFSVRLDEISYFITWPLVYLLGFTRIRPNQIALLSFLSGIGFLTCLYLGLLPAYPILSGILLVGRVLLDCADGQLARYTGQTSNLGSLYDLAADFVFAVALFAVLGHFLIAFEATDPGIVIPICILALLFFLTSSTVFSYLSLLDRNSDIYPAEARRRFIAPLPNDHPEKPSYAFRIKCFNLVFQFTWRLISYLSFILVLNPEKSDLHPSALRLLAPLEYGMHLTVLAFLVLFKVGLVYYLIYEITAFCVLFLLLLYHYRD